ncbi:Ornithine carbamoyltransferase [Yarrowia sp. C11]|nr:Ornithine carbamoyltransferase [Yarrowia sp. E02]KAG5369602.1 Ornithine carbamoyltransferase [Yarrowia sp. C11]
MIRPFSTLTKMTPRHLISIGDLSPKELTKLVERGLVLKNWIKQENKAETDKMSDLMKGKTVPLIFSKRSTRTRVSTEGAVAFLGGQPMFLGKDDIQLGVNESTYDTARVVSSMTSCMVARVGAHQEILDLSAASSVPVINALCEKYHPLQAITDMITIKETFGDAKNLKLAWVGDANNVLHDLAIAALKSGISVSAATPKEYPVSEDIVQICNDAAKESGATFTTTTDPKEAVKDADIVVTDTWISMGQESEKALKMQQFAGYQVTEELGKLAKPTWKFMHCLPRHPEEVSDEVFYSDRSLVFPEAENRLYAAIAVLEAFVVNKGKIE